MTGFSSSTRDLVYQRSDGVCERCSAGPVQQLHHRRARGSGGSKRLDTNTAANCLALCSPCHLYVETNRAEALDMGWLVRQGKNPEHVPVMYRRTGLVNLHEDGSITYM